MRMFTKVAAIVLALAFAASGCGGGGGDDGEGSQGSQGSQGSGGTPPPSTTTTTEELPGTCPGDSTWDPPTQTCLGGTVTGGGVERTTTTTTPGEEPFSIRIDGSGCTLADGQDMEGAFATPYDMAEYIGCFLPGILEWSDATYYNASLPYPTDFVYIPEAFVGEGPCGSLDDMALFYCPSDQSIYLGEMAAWEQYSVFGDGALPNVVGHEMTHYWQDAAGMADYGELLPNDIIQYENQADCGGGAYMDYAYDQGWLDADDDIIDLAGSLEAAGSYEDEGMERDHGTAEERIAAFNLGWEGDEDPVLEDSLYACNGLVADVALIV